MSRHWTILYTLQTINPLNSLSLSFFLQCFGRPLRNSCSMCWILEAIIFLFYFYPCSAPSALAFPRWSWRFYLTIHFLQDALQLVWYFHFPLLKYQFPLQLIYWGRGLSFFFQVPILYPSSWVSGLCYRRASKSESIGPLCISVF